MKGRHARPINGVVGHETGQELVLTGAAAKMTLTRPFWLRQAAMACDLLRCRVPGQRATLEDEHLERVHGETRDRRRLANAHRLHPGGGPARDRLGFDPVIFECRSSKNRDQIARSMLTQAARRRQHDHVATSARARPARPCPTRSCSHSFWHSFKSPSIASARNSCVAWSLAHSS